MALLFYIDGIPVNPSEISGLEGQRLTIRQKSQDGLAFSLSDAFQFRGNAKALIEQRIINATSPVTESIPAQIYDDCCQNDAGENTLVLDGIIRGKDLSWCEIGEECGYIETTITDNSQQANALACLQKRVIYARESDDGTVTTQGEDEDRPAPYIRYCIENRPKSLQVTLLFLGALVGSIIAPLLLLVGVIGEVIALLRPNADIFEIEDASQIIRSIMLGALACDERHKAPFVWSYIKNACRVCGLSASSSLFGPGGDFHNVVRIDAPYEHGAKDESEADEQYLDYNAPNITLPDLLDSFRDLNVDYFVQDNTLFVERKDYRSGSVWIDFQSREQDIVELCFEVSDEAPPAVGLYSYTNDQSDKTGAEATRLWSGNAIDYNNPVNSSLKGVDERTLLYGTARFIDDFPMTSTLRRIADGPFGTILFALAQTDGQMITQTGTFALPKLLDFEGITQDNLSGVRRYSAPSQGRFYYSVRTWLRENTQAVAGSEPTFYSELLKINDPRLGSYYTREYTLRFQYNCQDYRDFDFGKEIVLPYGNGFRRATVDDVEIDFDFGQMTVTGKV